MMSKNLTRIFLLMGILIVTVNSQTYSVNPITSSNNPSPTDQPVSLTTHVIKVGYMDYGYSRNNFTAGKGEALFWDWIGQTEHSVTESTLENPCLKKDGGFDLGQHSEQFNATFLSEGRTYVFFSYVSDDCKKGMYGGINLPPGYEWPKDLAEPPQQISTTPLNPTSTSDNYAPTGSMTIQAENSQNSEGSSAKSSSSDLKEPGYGIIIGA